jgi:hypothetical protein
MDNLGFSSQFCAPIKITSETFLLFPNKGFLLLPGNSFLLSSAGFFWFDDNNRQHSDR